MDTLKKGWFSEVNKLWPGSCNSYEVEETLFEATSRYQKVMVLQTTKHGRCVVLDDIIQSMEADVFSYNEMLTFLPLCSHPGPKKVLIIGGGSGGAAMQVLKHPAVEKLDVVEIDKMMLDASDKFFPQTMAAFKDPRVTLYTEDGLEFLKRQENYYDVIITDASEPIGPNKDLFSESYFEVIKNALRSGGVISMQAGCLWIALNNPKYDSPKLTLNMCRKVFGNAHYGIVSVPSYQCGQIGIVVASMNKEVDLRKPVNVLPKSFLDEEDLRYYSPKMHEAAFILPRFSERLFDSQ